MTRIDVGPLVAQGAYPHGDQRIGGSTSTIGRKGCLLCCYTMAARVTGGLRGLSVLDAHLRIDVVDGFDGANLIGDVAADALGMRLVERTAGFDLARVAGDLHRGLPVIVGTDYKPGRSSAVSDADHFVLALELASRTLVCADPAAGRLVELFVEAPVYRGKPCALTEFRRLAPGPRSPLCAS